MSETQERQPRERRSAEDRRKQLIGIGLRKLTTTPIHQLTIDVVAAEAHISRSLLFHYFPTKQDYYVEVVRAAGRRLLRATRTEAAHPAARIRQVVDGYVRYIQRRREPYLALFRGSTPEDWVRSVHDETLAALTERITDHVGAAFGIADVRRGDRVELTVRAWWAFAEELTIQWTGEEHDDLDTLVDLLIAALENVITLVRATQT